MAMVCLGTTPGERLQPIGPVRRGRVVPVAVSQPVGPVGAKSVGIGEQGGDL